MPSAHYKSSFAFSFLERFKRALRSEVTSGPFSYRMVNTHAETPITISSCVPVAVAASILRFSLLHSGVASANLEFPLFFELGWHDDWRQKQSGVWAGFGERHSCLLAE